VNARIRGLVPPADKGVEMRLFAVLVAICALTQTAMAQTLECKSISEPGARLACFDKGATTVASKLALRVAPDSKAAPAKYVDAISAEDTLMNARLKNICRGC
jgi:hypothetical protein